MELSTDSSYKDLLGRISHTYAEGRLRAYQYYPNSATLSHHLNWSHYPVNLVFYHRILRCFVLIDLKITDVQHHDIGQMNLYLGYFATEENIEGENPPIGIILTRNKDELLVEYATYQMQSQLFVQEYQLYLPDREELRHQLEMTLKEAEKGGEDE